MYGFEAINANNGWEISFLGICIVFTGLVLLSLAISQLHKILDLWENRDSYIQLLKDRFNKKNIPNEETAPDIIVTDSTRESARQFNILIKNMNEKYFPLPKLIKTAKSMGLMRPHFYLNQMLQIKLIIPDGSGFYYWEKNNHKKIMSKE